MKSAREGQTMIHSTKPNNAIDLRILQLCVYSKRILITRTLCIEPADNHYSLSRKNNHRRKLRHFGLYVFIELYYQSTKTYSLKR